MMNISPSTPPPAIRASRVLLLVNTAVWLTFAVLFPLRMARNGTLHLVTLVVVGGMMVGNAAAMLCTGLGLPRQRKRHFAFGLLLLAVNILLTFTDEFGLFDGLTLLLDVAIVGLLGYGRGYWRHARW